MCPEPHRKLDYSDYLGLPDDGKRYEIVEGDLHVTPSPRPAHQRVSKRLLVLLMDYFENRSIGEVFHAPVDLILTHHDVFVPDLLVTANPDHVSDRGIEAPPLLIVEILSPSTHKRDRGIKAQRYAELDVEHYWIVDPDRRRIEYYRLQSGEYSKLSEAEGDTHLQHPDWPELVIDLSTLWR